MLPGQYDRDVEEFVDQLSFQLCEGAGEHPSNKVLATWSIPGEMDDADQAGFDHQENDVFSMDMRGGWVSTKPLVKNKAGWDPCLACLLSYLCAYEFSPKEIKEDLKSDFPMQP